jgi:hypothetical protein
MSRGRQVNEIEFDALFMGTCEELAFPERTYLRSDDFRTSCVMRVILNIRPTYN